jgi:peptide/nickel transport system substrate-binding protein
MVSRRTSREPVAQGGWSCFITQIEGVAACTPGVSFEPRGTGAKAWFGWPDDEELERLRTAWFDAPDLPAKKTIAEKVQACALETLPCIPLGQLFQPTAFRSDIRHIVSGIPAVLWVRRAQGWVRLPAQTKAPGFRT